MSDMGARNHLDACFSLSLSLSLSLSFKRKNKKKKRKFEFPAERIHTGEREKKI